MFRLRDAAEVRRRLSFPNSGPGQNPAVLVGRLDGQGRADARFGELLYFVNVATSEQPLVLPELQRSGWRLHPVQAARQAADARPRRMKLDTTEGRIVLPARTALVLVRP